MKNADKVDIIIITCNAKNLLRRCISSIRRYTRNNDYLITVVDNGSRDGTIEFLKSQKDINLIRNYKNLGFPKAINKGIRKTHNDLIACIDDDVELTEGWLDSLGKYIKDERVGIVGCKIVFPDGRIHAAEYRIRPRAVVGKGEIDIGQKEYVREVDGLIGPCWLMKREVVEKTGYFDERFFPCQHEDLDYCIRARLAGYKIIYNGKVKVIHHNLFRDKDLSDENWERFLKKWHNLKYPFKDSHPADKYNARGYDYLMKKKFEKAFIEFKKAGEINKEFSIPFDISIAELALGKYEDALKNLKKLIRLDPDHRFSHRIHSVLGFINSKLDRDKEAIEEYKEALRINPRVSNVHYKLGAIYRRLGWFRKSMSEYKKAMASLDIKKRSPVEPILELEVG